MDAICFIICRNSTSLVMPYKEEEGRRSIEPVIGHCYSDHRLGRNFYKGLFGDSVNVILAAAAFNLKRTMRLLLCLIRKWLMERLAKVGERIILTKSPVDLSVPAF